MRTNEVRFFRTRREAHRDSLRSCRVAFRSLLIVMLLFGLGLSADPHQVQPEGKIWMGSSASHRGPWTRLTSQHWRLYVLKKGHTAKLLRVGRGELPRRLMLRLAGTVVGVEQSAYLWVYDATTSYYLNTKNIGSLHVHARINLNGRQSQWTYKTYVVSGPDVKMSPQSWNCVDDNGSLPNSSCSGGWQNRTNTSYTSSTFETDDSNYHQDNSLYWYDFEYHFYARGYPYLWNSGGFTSHHFSCHSVDLGPCRFQW
jgi:hypothetical protein